MENEICDLKQHIKTLEYQLQEQKAMLWLLGEIIKAATNISSFEELMKVLTDMLMGVTGVNTCYLWIEDRKKNLRVYCRSTEFKNEFREFKNSTFPKFIQELDRTCEFKKEEITEPLTDEIRLPESRLGVPLYGIRNGNMIGGLILEHSVENFFKPSNIAFFETLGVFIASNTTNSSLFENVSEASETDALTGIYNRRYLKRRMNALAKTHNQMVVVVIDTDNFKLVNDYLGHTKGDDVLRSIAQAAKDYFLQYDGEVIRYGGDEFVFLIPGKIEKNFSLLETFGKTIPELPVVKNENVPVTVTMGVCEYPAMTKDVMRALEVADHALIRGKHEGKNRVVIAIEEDFKNLEYHPNYKFK